MKALLTTLACSLLLVCAGADTSCGDRSPDIPVVASGHGVGRTRIEAYTQAWAEIMKKLHQASHLLGLGCEDLTCWNGLFYYSCDEGSLLDAVVHISFDEDPITEQIHATVVARGSFLVICAPCSGHGPAQLPQ